MEDLCLEMEKLRIAKSKYMVDKAKAVKYIKANSGVIFGGKLSKRRIKQLKKHVKFIGYSESYEFVETCSDLLKKDDEQSGERKKKVNRKTENNEHSQSGDSKPSEVEQEDKSQDQQLRRRKPRRKKKARKGKKKSKGKLSLKEESDSSDRSSDES